MLYLVLYFSETLYFTALAGFLCRIFNFEAENQALALRFGGEEKIG